MFYVYMIRNSAKSLYVGISEDPNKRVLTHNKKQGAQFTKKDSGYQTVFLEEYDTIAEARKREIQIKKWRREKKEILIDRYLSGFETK